MEWSLLLRVLYIFVSRFVASFLDSFLDFWTQIFGDKDAIRTQTACVIVGFNGI